MHIAQIGSIGLFEGKFSSGGVGFAGLFALCGSKDSDYPSYRKEFRFRLDLSSLLVPVSYQLFVNVAFAKCKRQGPSQTHPMFE